MTDSNAKTSAKEEIGYAWNFLADLGNGRQFSLSGNFPKGLSANMMNAEVDKVRSVFDRQQAQSACRGAGEHIEKLQFDLENAMTDLFRIDEKMDKKGGPSAQERQQREAAVAYIEKLKKDIDNKKEILKKLKAEAE